MKLTKFRVRNFKSVHDSGWICCDDVTTLVGVNEAGKSNLLLALWKLKPARGGEIDILHDMPTSQLSSLRTRTSEVPFIDAEFVVDESDIDDMRDAAGAKIEHLASFAVTRFYDGHYEFALNDGASIKLPSDTSGEDQGGESQNAAQELAEAESTDLEDILEPVMPRFVYYSNYGNLSSQIYLPYAIRWMRGQKVEGFDPKEDQVRTLRVLFDYVNLKPEEILELGQDPTSIARKRYSNAVPTQDEISAAAQSKDKRTILLNSAATKLTKDFRDWWRQGEYIFSFRADGEYLKIWVSDKLRPDAVALENRSTGLQWFLSFYLVFLVEAKRDNSGAVILLDEAGLSLHPKAQRNLVDFFDELSKENQIIHTTHSPFLVNTNRIDRCVAVYIDENGTTVASNNLKDGAGKLESKSVYAVHAAVGLSVSDVMLEGCYPVIVEGPSDQFVLSAIKTYLVSHGKFQPKKEIVFLPSGGSKAIRPIASILGREGDLPPVICDSDNPGRSTAKSLCSSLYKECPERVIELSEICPVDEPEVEDLVSYQAIKRQIDRMFSDTDDEFEDVYDQSAALVPQIESFAEEHGIVLERGKWKVELAKGFGRKVNSATVEVDPEHEKMWLSLFEKLDR